MKLTSKEDNELIMSTKGYLEMVGVQVDFDMSAFETNKESYIKVDESVVGKVDAIMQQLPQLLLNKVYSGDVYRVIYDKGLGVLQKSAQYPGQLLGNVVSPTANNKIKDVARLQELVVGPQIISNIFSVMSMVTGQYFMSQINYKLSRVEDGIFEIRKYLADDKRSKLQSEEDFLKMTQRTMNYIADNESQKYSTITSIQKIRIDSLAGINFYRMQINNLKRISAQKDKADDIIKNVQQFCSLISEYWYSLYLYCFAVYLEPVVAQNYDSNYLEMLKEDISEKCQCYKTDYSLWKEKLDEYLESAKAFGDNKIYEALKKVGKTKVYISAYVLIAQSLIEVFANLADNADKTSKEKKKKEATDFLVISKNWESIEAIETKQTELLLFDSLYNRRLELVKDCDGMYIKLLA